MKQESIRGRWWKFSRYKIENNYIVPTNEAEPLQEYDPMGFFQAEVAKRDEPRNTPPYLELINLFRRIQEPGPGQPARLRTWKLSDAEIDKSVFPEEESHRLAEIVVAEWCSKYGLLGVLPHSIERVELAPRRRRTEEFGECGQVIHQRSGHGWHTKTLIVTTTDAALIEPRVWLRTLGRGDLEIQPLIGTVPVDWPVEWEAFFPTVPAAERKTFQYPLPLTQEFWGLYREPVDKFINAARMLERSFRILCLWKRVPLAGKTFDEVTRWMQDHRQYTPIGHDVIHIHRQIESAMAHLESLLRTVNVVTEWDENTGAYNRHWQSTSLLGTLAMMAWIDLTNDDAYLIRCQKKGCYKLVRTFRPQTCFCSDACRNAFNQQQLRDKRKAKAAALSSNDNTSTPAAKTPGDVT